MSVCDSFRRQLFLFGFLLIASVCSSASATILLPGELVVPGRTASPAAAKLVVDTGALPFASIDGFSFSGTLRTQLYVNDAGNPFGPNYLTFTFLLTNNGPDALERLVTVRFHPAYQIDVGYNDIFPNGVIGAIPATVDRSGYSAGYTAVIGWNWSAASPLVAHQSSALLVIHTRGTSFQPFMDSVIDGSVATVPSFGLYLPEPATLGVAVVLMSALQFSRCHARTRSGSNSSKC